MRHALSTLVTLGLLLVSTASSQQPESRGQGIVERVPGLPTEVEANVIHPCRVDLTWSHRRPARVSFDVQRRAPGASFLSVALVSGTSYTDTAVQPATLYEYRVAAVRFGLSAESAVVVVGTPLNVAPVLSSSILEVPNAWAGMELTFRITAEDADLSPLSLRLLNPQPGLSFQPAVDAAPPLVRDVRWLIPNQAGGRHALRFQAVDCAGETAELMVVVQVGGDLTPTNLITGDVTGDGVEDVVAGASRADVGGVANAGAVYVWSGGGGGAPTATLTVPGAQTDDHLTDNIGQGLQLVDVTGDGVLDVIAAAAQADIGGVQDAGAVYLWMGGPTLVGTQAPDAILTLPQGRSQNQFGRLDATFVNDAQGLLFADIDGNGVLDIVVACNLADVGEATDAGVVALWYGGPGLTGSVAPDALCFVPGAVSGDQLGLFGGQGVQVEDVTGDGLPDIVAGATQAGADDKGALYVWAGASGLAGPLAPNATLIVPTAIAGDQLGYHAQVTPPYANQMLQLADVTGDGVADLVVGAPLADVSGVSDAGAVYVWEGGSGLAGTVAPRATLLSPLPVAGDQLTYVGAGQGVNLVDTNGDGILDLVVGAGLADVGGAINVGAWYVWRGGALLAGTPAPYATLSVVNPVDGDGLGFAGESTFLFADVTGDGAGDLILGAPSADYRLGMFASILNTGAVYVWSGGPGLVGTVTPTAKLTTTLSSTFLTTVSGRGLLAADLTGDGVLDVLAGSRSKDEAYLWAGGSGLVGEPAPTAILAAEDLGTSSGQSLQVADVTGDGLSDLLVTSVLASHKGVNAAGTLHVWEGGPGLIGTLAPTVHLGLAAPNLSDFLGENSSGYVQGVQLADLTADGCLDIVAFSRSINRAGKTQAGGMALWVGGPALTGDGDPAAALHPPNPEDRDMLGRLENLPAGAVGGFENPAQGVQLVDLQGDGLLEILAGASYADVNGIMDAGAAWLWCPDGTVPQGSDPQETFTVTGATAGDNLGGG